MTAEQDVAYLSALDLIDAYRRRALSPARGASGVHHKPFALVCFSLMWR